MRSSIILIILFFLCGELKTQIYTPTSPTIYGSNNLRLKPQIVLHLPVSNDTLLNTIDTSSQIRIINGQLQYHYGRWLKVASGSIRDTFTENFKINGVANYLKWVNNDIVPAKGLTAKELFLLGSANAVHPPYSQPTISLLNNSQSFEYGTYFGTFNYSYTYNQNNAGSTTGVTYYVNNAVQSDPYTVGYVTANLQFKVSRSYNAADTCLLDNFGTVDCYGRVTLGTVTSNIIQISPYNKRYLGFTSSLQGDGTPSDANVLSAYYIDNSGSTTSITNTAAQQTSAKYLFFVTTTPVTAISINGFPSTDAFNLNITRTFVNAVNGSYTYYFTISRNASFNAATTAISIN